MRSSGSPISSLPYHLRHEAVNFPHQCHDYQAVIKRTQGSGGTATTVNLSLEDSYFVHQPRDSFPGGYDDIVVWTSKEELITTLEKNGFISNTNFPVLREY